VSAKISDPPSGYTIVPEDDDTAKVKSGDIVWKEGGSAWMTAGDEDVGHEVYGFHAVARLCLERD